MSDNKITGNSGRSAICISADLQSPTVVPVDPDGIDTTALATWINSNDASDYQALWTTVDSYLLLCVTAGRPSEANAVATRVWKNTNNATGDMVSGDVVVCGINEDGRLVGLDEREAEAVLHVVDEFVVDTRKLFCDDDLGCDE